MEKKLDIYITVEEGEFEAVVQEPETGETTSLRLPVAEQENSAAAIGREIMSWVSLWADGIESSEANHGPERSEK